MQIVVKVAKKSLPEAVKLVATLLRRALPKADSKRASIEPVFPNVKVGRRAGMLTLSLDDRTSADSLAKLLDSLRASDAVEYAQPAAPKTAMATGSRRS
jgi:hypothetical protein